MTRINFTDGSSRWFSRESSIRFEERRRWDGRNMISCATGSQWDHQVMYYTQSGIWVLFESSQWQGTQDSVKECEDGFAVKWLLDNECMSDDQFLSLPKTVQDAIEQQFASNEV